MPTLTTAGSVAEPGGAGRPEGPVLGSFSGPRWFPIYRGGTKSLVQLIDQGVALIYCVDDPRIHHSLRRDRAAGEPDDILYSNFPQPKQVSSSLGKISLCGLSMGNVTCSHSLTALNRNFAFYFRIADR